MGNIAKVILLAGLYLLVPGTEAAVFEIRTPSADTSLIEIAPTNNNGGQAWVLAGRIQNDFYRNRGLFKFDFADLPTNSVVLSAALVLIVTRIPAEPPTNSAFGLHRMLRPWGEGNKIATIGNPPGRGMPADPGEATWLCAFAFTNEWAAPGGAAGADFSAGESSFAFIAGLGSYRFEFTPELADDVQSWVNHPESNFGWLLLCNREDENFTSRRFGSREDLGNQPGLEIEYLVPPQIDAAERVGDEFQLSFTPWPGQGYAVQFRDSLSTNAWQTLTNIGVVPDATPLLITDSATVPQRFYRVIGY